MEVNNITITGAITDFISEHTFKGECYKTVSVNVKRKSGVIDALNVVLKSDTINALSKKINIYGSVRSRWNEHKLVNYIFAEDVNEAKELNVNELIIEGHVCRQPYCKMTRNGWITSFMICSTQNRSHYVPIVIWQKLDLKQGDHIVVTGTLQSRTYWNGNELRTVTEISGKNVAVFGDKNGDKIAKRNENASKGNTEEHSA